MLSGSSSVLQTLQEIGIRLRIFSDRLWEPGIKLGTLEYKASGFICNTLNAGYEDCFLFGLFS